MADDFPVLLCDNIAANLSKLGDFLFEVSRNELGRSGDE
jgi:hypothetical protein